MNISRCNRCNPGARCKGDHKERCKGFKPACGTWKLAELALEHPPGFSEVLHGTPFETDVDGHIYKEV